MISSLNKFLISLFVIFFLSRTNAFHIVSVGGRGSLSVVKRRVEFLDKNTIEISSMGNSYQTSCSRLKMASESTIGDLNPPRLVYGFLWLGLITYAFTVAPGGDAAASAIDQELIMKMISTPFDGTCNALFVAVFNFLGIIPAVLAALLLPGSKDQKIPALPFVLSSFAVGLFGVGPYLGLREVRTEVTKSTQGLGSGAFEFKGTAVLLLGFGLYLYYYLFSQTFAPGSGGIEGVITGYIDLFKTQRLVHVSSMDCAILSAAMWDPLREDMARRYDSESPSTIPAWAYCLLPAVGPALYLLLRPELKEE